MPADNQRIILVTGATGLQGSAVTRHLLASGWRVRGLTRNPASEKARALASLGAEVVQGDMAEPATLQPVFEGAYGVFSVQNPVISGEKGEILQGKNVGNAARKAGVQHLVYASAGTGVAGTGVASWESKIEILNHLKALGLPLTVIRPMAFMELMTEKKFYPSVGVWQLMPRLMGSATKVIWACTDDVGAIVEMAFSNPEQFIGKEIQVGSDVQSIDECRAIYKEVRGKSPPRFPMPLWVFERFGFMGKDLSTMWRWLREGKVDLDTGPTCAILPEAATVKEFLQRSHAG